jgi:hypothetical protein
MIEEMRDERQDIGRLMVIVYTGTERLPKVDPVVQNIRPGPAKGVSFEVSSPSRPPTTPCTWGCHSSRGASLRWRPAPGSTSIGATSATSYLSSKRTARWPSTSPSPYATRTGNRYEHDWDVQPAVLEGIRATGREGADDPAGQTFVRALRLAMATQEGPATPPATDRR